MAAEGCQTLRRSSYAKTLRRLPIRNCWCKNQPVSQCVDAQDV